MPTEQQASKETTSPPPHAKPIKRLFTPFLISKTVPTVPLKEERKQYPYHEVNWISKIFLTWLVPLYNVGYKRTLTVNDLWVLPEKMEVSSMFAAYQKNINKQQRVNIFKAIVSTFQRDFIVSLILRLLTNTGQIVTPLLVKRLIMIVQLRVANPNSFPISEGIGYSIGISVLLIFNTLCQQHSMYYSKIIGAKTRSVLTKHLLLKTSNATAQTRFEFPMGKIVSLMSADLAKLELALAFLPTLLSIPIPIVIGIALLIDTIGVAALAGISTIFLILGISVFPAKGFMKNRTLAAPFTDVRISLIREVLQSMKMIKFYAWENAYERKITEIRSKEMNYILWAQNNINLILSLMVGVPSLASMVTFLTLYGINSAGHGVHQKSVAEIFASLSLFGVISGFITNIPMLLSNVLAGAISLNRLGEYLNASEEEEEEEESKETYKDSVSASAINAISIKDGFFEWEDFTCNSLSSGSLSSSSPNSSTKVKFSTLHDITLEIPHGSLTVIIGSIGSGKSSLLSAINGDMKSQHNHCSISISGSKILCGEPWIQNTTVRENVLFGSSYDKKLYQDVLEACCLLDDLKLLTHGDLTEIGERGVTLSGGQKARISLARAVYKRRDIYLLDDVLSAVDASVGAKIIDGLLLDFLKNQTRVIVTHQLSLVPLADQVVFMNGDGTLDVGSADHLQKTNEQFRQLMTYYSSDSAAAEIDDTPEEANHETSKELIRETTDNLTGSLYNTEESAINSIPLSLYRRYFTAGQGNFGSLIHGIIIASVSSTAFCFVFINVWLSFWVERRFDQYSDSFYIGIYVLFVVVFFICLFTEVVSLGFVIVEASRTLNIKAISKIIHTPMSYMDTTPMGRILNRFAKDTNSMDNELAAQLKFFVHGTSLTLAIIILSVVYLPWFALAIPVLAFVLVSTANYYQSSSREIKRLEAITRSFLYNQFNEILSGLTTIKYYGHESRFLSITDQLTNNLNEVYLVTVANQRWIQIVIDTMTSLMVIIVTMLSLTGQFNISPASTGLICTMFIQLSFLLSFAMNAYAELENEMNSVERICHYAFDLEQEAAYTIPETKPSPNWPQNGTISFENVSMRYRKELPLVLKNLSIFIEGSEKIGICGRTGAGKSTLMTALYRLVDLSSGKILIDGVDISKIGLHELRSNLAIIPQDPVLFQGTLRKNLDPFDELPDSELNDALLRSGLIGTTTTITAGLDTEVEDGGANFSLGERQLIALTRAIVRNSKVLIMDEATSSVDYKTDALIQRTLAVEFKDSTVLCIAHRLKTIIHYDKIVVLDEGSLAEFGTPMDLFNKETGIFRSLCDASKISSKDFILDS